MRISMKTCQKCYLFPEVRQPGNRYLFITIFGTADDAISNLESFYNP